MQGKSPKKILVVDDDPVMTKLLEKRLKVDGYDVISALSGSDGIAKAIKEKPALIVLDLMIPDINGVDVTKELKKNDGTKTIPIVFISVTLGVENDKGDEKIEIDGEFFRIFAKPLHNRKLLSVIRKEINKFSNQNKS